MINPLSSISFKSNIKLISPEKFKEKTSILAKDLHEVDYPWTPNEIKTGKNLFTLGILDCIAGGIIYDNKVRLFHQGNWTEDTAKKYSQDIFDSTLLESKLLEGINLVKDNIHAFILGGLNIRDGQENSLLSKIQAIFENNKIPLTTLTRRKDVHFYGKFSLLFENDSDTWFITNNLINNNFSLNKQYKNEIELKNGLVEYNIYAPASEAYKGTRVTGTTEDFFKSQFVDVNLSKFDRFVSSD